ncbi:hypothetical protein [Cryobacterium sp. Y29]|uniref:hypothetical protein n=1 Tax=Cryobacterium sp. Y29 TaxID=2048285 RepID=UPI0011B0A36B|nr:hypothetical protein [Cryobacterium sp. Y29]
MRIHDLRETMQPIMAAKNERKSVTLGTLSSSGISEMADALREFIEAKGNEIDPAAPSVEADGTDDRIYAQVPAENEEANIRSREGIAEV